MSDADKAITTFKEGFSCSQSILSTYGTKYGISHDLALKISGPFGGGMARMGKTCGAVTGAFMVLGLKFGTISSSDKEKKERLYELTKVFTKQFKARNGSISCRKLLGCDISTTEGMKILKEKDLVNTLCAKFVRDSAQILEQLIK